MAFHQENNRWNIIFPLAQGIPIVKPSFHKEQREPWIKLRGTKTDPLIHCKQGILDRGLQGQVRKMVGKIKLELLKDLPLVRVFKQMSGNEIISKNPSKGKKLIYVW